MSCRAQTFAGLACLGCLLAGGCAPAPARIFVDQADRLHNQSLASAVVGDRDLSEYVQLVGLRLSDAAHEVVPQRVANSFFSNIQFHLVDTPVVNAFTTGGRHVYVYRGLFQFCETEEELAAAMAHAYAHIINRDVEHLAMKPDPKRPLNLVAWQFVSDRFTSEQETEADNLAFQLYVKAGWDPTKFENLWQRLRDRYAGAAAPDRPSLETRAMEARRWGKEVSPNEIRPPVADRKTFAALHRQLNALTGPLEPQDGGELFLTAFPNCLVSRDLPAEVAAQARLRPPAPPAVKLEPN